MKDTPFEIISKSLGQINGSDLEDILTALDKILEDKNNREFLLGEYDAKMYREVVGISAIHKDTIDFLLSFEGGYITIREFNTALLMDEVLFEQKSYEYWTEKHNKEIIKAHQDAKKKEEAEYAQYLELKKKFEKKQK